MTVPVIPLLGGFSIAFAVDGAHWRIAGAALLVVGAAVVAGLRTCRGVEKEKAG